MKKRSQRWSTVAFVMASLMLASMAYGLYIAQHTSSAAGRDELKVEYLRGRIVYLDEILTMSVRMAVSERDVKWEKRYHKFKPELEAALEEAKNIETLHTDGIGKSFILLTIAANIRLVKMEEQAIGFTSAGRFCEARDILFGDTYEEQKIIYATGMNGLKNHLRQVVADRMRHESKRVSLYIAAIIGAILLAGTPAVLQILRRRRELTEQLETVSMETTKLSVAVEQSPAVIVITDTTGRIEYVNPRFTEVTGYTKEEAIGQNPRILQSGKWPQKAYEGLWRTILAGKTWRGEFQNRKKNGEMYWESASISPVRNTHGEITHFLAVKEDITERKLKEKELKKAKADAESANRAKSEFLANMSHEIRTPMTAILGYSEMLEEDGDIDRAPPSRLHAINAIRRNGDHLLQIINDILDLSKIEADKLEIKTVACDVKTVVDYATDAIRPRVGSSVNVTTNIGPSVPREFFSSDVRLRQILLNLLGNAAKFTEEGEISIAVQCEGGRITFDVSDTGCGMTPEQAASLFQPFHQIDNSATRKHGGTGLGLVISKRLAEMLGGDVIVVRSSEGEGSLFRLDLPCDASTSDEEKKPYQEKGTLSGLRVLLADDSEDNRAVIGAMLKRLGAKVKAVENGKEAVEAVIGGDFDIVLMDLHMPVMDGLEATRVLRDGGYNGPVVAVTGCTMEQDIERCLAAGCDAHLPKPVTSTDLLAIITESCLAAA